ncbi:cation efflux protein [Mycena metata]|uniref:Cation efflux protein n=1 Tax=Mycena metata TaxID=1033252 RepID=A0AAD7MH75_9AGAR|nr:cation efflux protein [Mycena metata]
MSRSTRIKILLAIDVVFFFVEIISGYAVGSLALVADSFHMLNDVMSLIVALYAIKLTEQSANDSRYSYGWHRAEILAALINGVFLVALCFSIGLEALERFFAAPEITNPRLVIIVGSFGLASNLVGLFLFHEHGHSHGHSHDGHDHAETPNAKALPAASSGLQNGDHGHDHVHNGDDDDEGSGSEDSEEYAGPVGSGHPVMTRASIVRVAHDMARSPTQRDASETTPLLSHSHDDLYSHSHSPSPAPHSHSHSPSPSPAAHASSPHAHSKDAHGHSHGHGGSMNMRALVLHVLGDALGNVGVICTGLILLLAPPSWNGREVYFDPAISLVIACIILGSAVPLVRSASFVLLQGVPATISLERVRAAILAVEGVQSLHELHIWQLSESKNIASVHVLAARELDFMPIAAQIRRALHDQGIHSCTIQPEYYGSTAHLVDPSCAPFPSSSAYADNNADDAGGVGGESVGGGRSGANSVRRRSGGAVMGEDTPCLVLCPPEECDPRDNACCPPGSTDV